MARSLAKSSAAEREAKYAAEFEAPEFITLGIVYERNSRFAGGAYSPFLKKLDRFADRPLATTLRDREAAAARLVEIDAQVKRLIAKLQAQGLRSPYLRNYVVARINPVRFHKAKKGDTKPPMTVAQGLLRMSAAARGFDTKKVSSADLAWVAAGAESAD
jgi:ParB family chromosome partitioning protein